MGGRAQRGEVRDGLVSTLEGRSGSTQEHLTQGREQRSLNVVEWQLPPRVCEGFERRDERTTRRVHLALRAQARSFELPMLELEPGRQRRHHMLRGRRDDACRTGRCRG